MKTDNNVPTFSVIIPAYNAETFVCDALDSVARQTVSDYEVIVIDDGSTDGTCNRINLWIQQHPTVKAKIIRQLNKGIGGARNAGILQACGIFVAFLDADDFWLVQKLESVKAHIKLSTNVDLICHDIWIMLDTKNRKRMNFGPYTSYKDLLFKDNSISTSATVVRRKKILDVGGFSEDMRFNSVEDYDLWLRLARAGCCIEYLHTPLSVYRLGQGISNNVVMHNRHIINVLNSHFQEWPSEKVYDRILKRRRRGNIIRASGNVFLKKGKRRNAQRYLWLALKLDPFNWKTWVLLLWSKICGDQIKIKSKPSFDEKKNAQ